MMTRTSFMLPDELHAKAKMAARRRGVSLGQFLRDSVTQHIKAGATDKRSDPLFHLDVYDGPVPRDGSGNHDRYLYGDRRRRR